MPSLVANNQTVANSLLYFLSGSLNNAQMYYHIYDSQNLVNFVLLNPGFSNQAQTNGPLDGSYFDLRNLANYVPNPPAPQPIPLTKPNQPIYAFYSNFTTPYIQNLTLSVTRDLRKT